VERKVASRRRGEELEQAILKATWEEFQEVGFAKLSMEGVAKRAGTSKPVIYRRWPSRMELMVACATSRMPTAGSIPDTGTLRGDTIAVLKLLRGRMFVVGQSAMLGMLSTVSEDPVSLRSFVQRFVSHLLTLMDKVVERAGDRGELDPDLLGPRLRKLPIDLARNEFLITGELGDEAIEEILDQVFFPALQGIGALRAP
jgi:AcrR family transcriptional regulator